MSRRNKTKGNKITGELKLFTTATLALILSLIAIQATLSEDDNTMDFLDLGWYDVEPWEIQVCSTIPFSEAKTLGSGAEPGEAVDLELFSGETIITLQAEATGQPDNSTTLQLSWYVQPLTTTVNYELKLKYESSAIPDEVIESSSATVASGYTGYKVLTLPPEKQPKEATLKIQEGNLELTVPVVK